MGLGQTLLTIMALMLMGRLILTTNTSTLDAGFTKDMAEYRITATSLGTSALDNANALSFDEATVDTFVTNTAGLSMVLHAEAGEDSVWKYDDIDDYNNYTKVDTIENSAVFITIIKVNYVNIVSGAVVTTTTPTYNKMISVNVTSDYLVDYSTNPPKRDTLKFQSIFSYWYFR